MSDLRRKVQLVEYDILKEFDRISKNACSQPSRPLEPKITPGRSLTLSAPLS